MLTPAAKKRRVEAANATLRKPFRSPLISRPKTEEGAASTSPITTPTIRPGSSSSRTSTPLRQAKAGAAGEEDSGAGPVAELLSVNEATASSSPERIHKRVKSLGRPSTSSTRSATAAAGALGAAQSSSATPLGALLVGFEKHLAAVDARLRHDEDLRRQAERIVAESERRRPGGPPDAELVALIAKWKGASRAAADEVFGFVKGRVDAAGGTKAWKRMRQRQDNFFAGGDGDELVGKEKRGGIDGEDYDEGDIDPGGSEEGKAQRDGSQAGNDEADDDESDEEFTMLMMLRSLNIDPKLLGYNEAEDRWDD